MKRMTKGLMVVGLLVGILSIGTLWGGEKTYKTWVGAEWLPDWVKVEPRETTRIVLDLNKISGVERVTVKGKDGMQVVVLVDETGYLKVQEGCPPGLWREGIFVEPGGWKVGPELDLVPDREGDGTQNLGRVRVGPDGFWVDRDQDGTEELHPFTLSEAPEDADVIDLGWSMD